tara:strand:- start:767 stop:1321 length:555 start_codon:yes stop_codon:yes gene_type:complete
MGFFDNVNTENNEQTAENVDADADVNVEEHLDNEEEDEYEVRVDTDSEQGEETVDLIISSDVFEKFASVFGFMFGLLINWGSLNIIGFMIGLNYRYLLATGTYNKLITEVQTIIPAFMLGVLIVHLSLIYFTLSVFVGYAVKSKNLSVFNEDFFAKKSIEINVRNYKGVFYELLGIIGNEKKES